MDILNNKIQATQDELKYSAQNVGLYGYDSTESQWRRLACDNEGKLNIEATLELDSSTLAKEVTLTDGTQKAKCMGIDTATSLQHQFKVAPDGALHIISENFDSMLIKGVETGTSTQRDCKQNANGDLRVQLIGNDGNDGAGTMRVIGCNSNGFLKVKDDELETNFISGLFSTQMMGRTTIGDTATRKNLLCDTNGVLQVNDISGGGGGGGTQFAGESTLASTGTGTAMIGRDSGNVARLVATDTSGNLQIDLLSNADTTKATSTLQTAGNASLTTIAGAVSGTEVQVDVRNRTDAIPVDINFSAGNKIIAATGTTRTGTIDVGGCSSYVIMMNMLFATTNSSEFANCDISIEYSPDDGTTFMGTVNMSGSLEMVEPKALYQASGTSGGTIVGYGIYIQATSNMSSPLMGNARTNKIKIAVQNPFGSALTLDDFSIYKFN